MDIQKYPNFLNIGKKILFTTIEFRANNQIGYGLNTRVQSMGIILCITCFTCKSFFSINWWCFSVGRSEKVLNVLDTSLVVTHSSNSKVVSTQIYWLCARCWVCVTIITHHRQVFISNWQLRRDPWLSFFKSFDTFCQSWYFQFIWSILFPEVCWTFSTSTKSEIPYLLPKSWIIYLQLMKGL